MGTIPNSIYRILAQTCGLLSRIVIKYMYTALSAINIKHKAFPQLRVPQYQQSTHCLQQQQTDLRNVGKQQQHDQAGDDHRNDCLRNHGQCHMVIFLPAGDQ